MVANGIFVSIGTLYPKKAPTNLKTALVDVQSGARVDASTFRTLVIEDLALPLDVEMAVNQIDVYILLLALLPELLWWRGTHY